ncbi:MAG: hypothetical protein IIZ44_02920 [Muribaculaceae bacterium]|nr:hypothetical protein [Muribaculaceae bacterium]
MNVKLHTPKSLKAGSGLSSAKQFFLSIVATSISIALTFGTAAFLDHQKKASDKKEMVMMIINDFDQSIELLQKADTLLHKASARQQELAVHPELFDSQNKDILDVISLMINGLEFPETAEKIFTSNIESFSTIGDVNFINEVSSFYISRHKYKDLVQQWIKDDIEGKAILSSLQSLFNVSFPEYYFLNWSFLQEMKDTRDRCMSMMNVSEKELAEFSQQHMVKHISPEREAYLQKMREEMIQDQMRMMEAQEKYKN